jgi:hypothetical protein
MVAVNDALRFMNGPYRAEFDLVRLKLNVDVSGYVGGETPVTLHAPAELIDVSFMLPNDRKSYLVYGKGIEEWTTSCKLVTERRSGGRGTAGEEEATDVRMMSLESQVYHDILPLIFHEMRVPWEDGKYPKRTTKLMSCLALLAQQQEQLEQVEQVISYDTALQYCRSELSESIVMSDDAERKRKSSGRKRRRGKQGGEDDEEFFTDSVDDDNSGVESSGGGDALTPRHAITIRDLVNRVKASARFPEERPEFTEFLRMIVRVMEVARFSSTGRCAKSKKMHKRRKTSRSDK